MYCQLLKLKIQNPLNKKSGPELFVKLDILQKVIKIPVPMVLLFLSQFKCCFCSLRRNSSSPNVWVNNSSSKGSGGQIGEVERPDNSSPA